MRKSTRFHATDTQNIIRAPLRHGPLAAKHSFPSFAPPVTRDRLTIIAVGAFGLVERLPASLFWFSYKFLGGAFDSVLDNMFYNGILDNSALDDNILYNILNNILNNILDKKILDGVLCYILHNSNYRGEESYF